MPAIINIWGHFSLGVVLAYVARHQLLRAKSSLTPALIYLLAFQVILSIPVCAYLSHFFPHWTLLYFFDPQIFINLYQFPGILSFTLICLNTMAALLGFFLFRQSLKHQQKVFWAGPLTLSSATILILFVQYYHRIFFIGNHATYWQGGAKFWLAHISGWLGLSMMLAGFVLLVWLRKSRHLR
tara:strand:+ start:59 stop:607 length:549 start_codon:yes stop_codon:yes gene_type:complete